MAFRFAGWTVSFTRESSSRGGKDETDRAKQTDRSDQATIATPMVVAAQFLRSSKPEVDEPVREAPA